MRVSRRQSYAALGTVLVHQSLRLVDIDNPPAIDDRDAIAQSLGFFHQVRGKEDSLAAGANVAHQIPDLSPSLRIEAGSELVEKDDLGIVDQSERDEETLLLPARQRHEPRVAFLGEAELLEEMIADGNRFLVKRCPQVHRLPDLDSLL